MPNRIITPVEAGELMCGYAKQQADKLPPVEREAYWEAIAGHFARMNGFPADTEVG